MVFLVIFNVHFWEREHKRGRAERERETQYPKQAPGSELSGQSPTWASNSWTVKSWPESKSDTQPTESHPGAPVTWWFYCSENNFWSQTFWKSCHFFYHIYWKIIFLLKYWTFSLLFHSLWLKKKIVSTNEVSRHLIFYMLFSCVI